MTPSMVAAWILDADFKTLERKIRGFSSINTARALDWARNYMENPDGDSARSKLAVAVLGTLVPEELETE